MFDKDFFKWIAKSTTHVGGESFKGTAHVGGEIVERNNSRWGRNR